MDLLIVGNAFEHGNTFWPDWESFCAFYPDDLRNGKLPCTCGETNQTYNWNWEPQRTGTHVLSNGNREVVFHPVYSPGTAAVRGNKILEKNMHHYWEIKILTKLYGTDVMIGVGTPDVSLEERQYKFCSMLGCEDQSWGYSYRGSLQHNKLTREYGPPFGIGTIIGIHLDMYSGTLEYYMNRKPLGIAFRGLKNKDLYPMVCSTAAQSSIRLISAFSFPDSLEMTCLKVISSRATLKKQFNSIPGLTRLIKPEYFWCLPGKDERNLDIELSVEDEAILPLKTVVEIETRQRKRLRTNKWGMEYSGIDQEYFTHRDFFRKVTHGVIKSLKKKPYYSPSCQKCSLRPDLNVNEKLISIGEIKKKIGVDINDVDIYGDIDDTL
ncbi:SPRY domain-containing SOCS box protein 3 [Onthophagus taurus]|uniref:SPRY domain-containing SOCS box protein 3 n=1 Tax=Onthophagus taurus TaxID=166361 RepID=UPI000C20DE9E|nr:SPRY domain-containing SOCS box protein 3 [Onthophagus taurus]XP_022916517.1 SPRY domain-containing SOCS box protein 3 [Onthophagus taurus]